MQQSAFKLNTNSAANITSVCDVTCRVESEIPTYIPHSKNNFFFLYFVERPRLNIPDTSFEGLCLLFLTQGHYIHARR